jgi:hypothetical protein
MYWWNSVLRARSTLIYLVPNPAETCLRVIRASSERLPILARHYFDSLPKRSLPLAEPSCWYYWQHLNQSTTSKSEDVSPCNCFRRPWTPVGQRGNCSKWRLSSPRVYPTRLSFHLISNSVNICVSEVNSIFSEEGTPWPQYPRLQFCVWVLGSDLQALLLTSKLRTRSIVNWWTFCSTQSLYGSPEHKAGLLVYI